MPTLPDESVVVEGSGSSRTCVPHLPRVRVQPSAGMATLAAELRINPITVSKCRLPSATNGLDGLLDAPRQGAARTIPANVVETVVADRLESAHRRENCSTRGLAAKHGTRPSNRGQDLSGRSSSNRRQPPDQGVACSRGSDDHSRRLGRGRHQPAPHHHMCGLRGNPCSLFERALAILGAQRWWKSSATLFDPCRLCSPSSRHRRCSGSSLSWCRHRT